MMASSTKPNIDLLQIAGLEDLQSLAIIGLSKNAGKTTCLNHIIAAWQESEQKRPLALTSIGRDGESEDILSGYEKPRIYVSAGTLIASAESALQRSDTLLEILDLSGIRTAFGEVVLCRALSDGYVELAGPSVAEEISVIENLIRLHEPECLFIIDGALSRKSQAGSGMSEAVILCVSAESSTDPATLAELTDFALTLLQTKTLQPEQPANSFMDLISEHPEHRVFMLHGNDNSWRSSSLQTPSLVGHGKEIAELLKPDTYFLFLKGAVTDQIVRELLAEPMFTELTLVVEDGTRFFLSPDCLFKLHDRKVDLAVINPLDVRLVCLNPTCSNGICLEPDEALNQLRDRLTIPVVDLGPRNM